LQIQFKWSVTCISKIIINLNDNHKIFNFNNLSVDELNIYMTSGDNRGQKISF